MLLRASVLMVVSIAFAGCQKETVAPAAAPATPTAAPAPAPAPAAAAPAAPAGPSRVEVQVTDDGFVPARIPAKAGVPITLVITRKVERTCAREILFQGQPEKTELPLNKAVEVVYTPKAAGEIKFGCAMGMMIGGVLAVAN